MGSTVTMIDAEVLDPALLEAVTIPVKVPTSVGIPVILPFESMAKPKLPTLWLEPLTVKLLSVKLVG